MSLFQESIIRKHLGALDQEVVDQAYLRFKEVYSSNKISNIKIAKEEQYQEGFIKDIFGAVLGYSVFPEQPFNIQTEKKNEADSKKADGAIFQGENVVGVIELKDNKTKNLDAVKDQAFGYKNNHKDCSYVISSNFHKLRFYVDDATDYEEFDLYNLDKETFKRFYLYLRKEGLLDKNIPRLLRQETRFHEENITKSLYKDYSSFKNSFYQNVVKNNPQHDKLLLFKKSQKFLDKVLFVLFAEDKGLVTTNSIVQIVEKWQDLKNDAFDTPKPLYQLVALFFNNLFVGKKDQKGGVLIPEFGGEIFAPDEVLDNLIVDDAVLKDDLLKLSKYDYNTDVDVNILGHIFEHSLSELEEVEAELKGEVADKTKGKRKKDGVFYTPKYITKYIVENTIGKLCSEKKEELKLDIDIAIFEHQKADGKLNVKGIALYETLNQYKAWLLTLKILDPACGSGAFLNQAVNFLVLEHQFADDLIAELTNTPLRLFDTDIAILENNIYGVDINEESIEIAKLSLWLRTAKQGRKLSNLSNNIKCGNSLIDDPAVAGDKAFNWHNEFPEVFANGGFDVVIGNPPWGASFSASEKQYLVNKYLSKAGEAESCVYFIDKSFHNLLSNNGIISFITPNTWFYLDKYDAIRKSLIDFDIIEMLELEKNIFEDAPDIVPVIFFIRKSNERKEKVRTFKLIKGAAPSNIGEKGKYIINEIEKDNWRFLDNVSFNLLFNRETCSLIEKITKNSQLKSHYKVRYGIKTGDNKMNLSKNSDNGENWKYCLPSASAVKRNSIVWEGDYLHFGDHLSGFSNNSFERPKIIIQYIRKISMERRLICAFDIEGKYYPLNNFSFIESIDNEYSLEYLITLLNSNLLNFYFLNCFIDYNIKPKYIEKLPMPELNLSAQQPFVEKANIMLSLNKELEEAKQKFQRSIERKFELKELSKRLQDWYLLSYDDFIKELAKKKLKLSLSKEAEWETYFTTEAKKALDLKAQIEIIDKEIDQMVYALYELTEDEIKIVEGS